MDDLTVPILKPISNGHVACGNGEMMTNHSPAPPVKNNPIIFDFKTLMESNNKKNSQYMMRDVGEEVNGHSLAAVTQPLLASKSTTAPSS